MVKSLLSFGAAAYHFGNAVDMVEMLEKIPSDIVVMGNVDPAGVLRMGTPESVRETTLDIMERCSEHHNFVISSGCDIPPLTPWENIDAFFDAVEEFYK
jgi:uroporphyrinogen decarboxylase